MGWRGRFVTGSAPAAASAGSRPSECVPHNVIVAQFEVPALVRRRALAMGETGAAWLQQLGATVSAAAADWDLQVGRVLDGGSGALVAESRHAR